jgi:amino acid transporter
MGESEKQEIHGDAQIQAGRAARLKRCMKWYDGFALAMSVPALLLYSLGSEAAVLGVGSIVVWCISMAIAVPLIFGYAELAGLFPTKTGGMGVFQYLAWRNSDIAKNHPMAIDAIGVVGVWGYWWAWSPVLAIGGLIVGHWFQFIFPQLPQAFWMQVLIGALFLGLMYLINYFGIAGGAKMGWILTACCIIPLFVLTVLPFVEGKIIWSNFVPFLPLDYRFQFNYSLGLPPVYCTSWFTWPAIYGIIGGLFIAAWSTYGYEAAAVYTAEYANPRRDTALAIGVATIFVAFFFILLPIVAIGVDGIQGIQADYLLAIPKIGITLFGNIGGYVTMFAMMAGILLALNQATNGGGRALYQMAEDGLLLKQFAAVNKYKVPSVAMGYDVIFNVFLMSIGSPIAIYSASAVGYLIVNVLANRSISYMRSKFPNANRPFKVWRGMWPFTKYLWIVNGILLIGAPVFGGYLGTLLGVTVCIIVVCIYLYRHKVQDKPGYRIFGEHLLPDYLRGTPDAKGKINKTLDRYGFTLLIISIYAIIFIFAYLANTIGLFYPT